MLYFPQLATGSSVQYPLVRSTMARTVLNRLADESVISLADTDSRAVSWELRYQALSDVERVQLESFFEAAGGQLRTFVFLDPAANLLRWSSDFSRDAWTCDGLLQIVGKRLTNAGQVMQGMRQAVGCPGWYRYCFSARVRGGFVRLSLGNDDAEITSDGWSDERWRQIWCSGELPGASTDLVCKVELRPGESVEIDELMLAAQPMPASYRGSESASGVYPSTRFAEDQLTFTADGPNLHSVTVRLFSNVQTS